ncbi:hypothetical protein BSN85_24815 [Bradyrhizobium brasilense]|uniref:hypothetical protein n=1 Tax=Bradyrhizobium brasilense TaxID=1419277 RepID=UPI00097793C5|nr:hypothetical protein [Bradyrhizobium brasilense]OMI05518.1 hypothetical protein BSN85_24815 [Bradyrhizobium brasilense]
MDASDFLRCTLVDAGIMLLPHCDSEQRFPMDDDRLSNIINKVELKRSSAEADRQARLVLQQKREDKKAAAPQLWREQRPIFEQVSADINERIASIWQKIMLEGQPNELKAGHLDAFQVVFFEGERRSDSFYTCAVDSYANLLISRRLPGLSDSDEFPASAMNRSTIQTFFLDFLENVQGLRSLDQMMTYRHKRNHFGSVKGRGG